MKKVINGTFSPVIEEPKALKKGKKGKWAKSVNRKFNHWIYGYVLKRIKELCEVAGVQWHTVPPQYTSRTCSECGY
ncbi:MAG: zinc ribbon domain-containing protein [Aquificaceae bacterium]|nr:zinc ribbon domain-containing protein [Aquificaceae bacterium]